MFVRILIAHSHGFAFCSVYLYHPLCGVIKHRVACVFYVYLYLLHFVLFSHRHRFIAPNVYLCVSCELSTTTYIHTRGVGLVDSMSAHFWPTLFPACASTCCRKVIIIAGEVCFCFCLLLYIKFLENIEYLLCIWCAVPLSLSVCMCVC